MSEDGKDFHGKDFDKMLKRQPIRHNLPNNVACQLPINPLVP